jgi:hypothetical protein
MLKKIGIPMMALAAMLILAAPPQASAAVRFGVYVGGPAYAYPAYPYSDAYPNTGYYNAYPAYPAYPYPAPAYVYPYRSWRGHEYREFRDRRHESREREWREREGRGRFRR